MKRFVALFCTVYLIISMAGCGNGQKEYIEEVQSLGDLSLTEFFQKVPEVNSLLTETREADIDKSLWEKGIANDNYHGQFKIAGYDGIISLIMENQKVSMVTYSLNNISADDFISIAESGKTVFGEPVIAKDNSISWLGTIILYNSEAETVSISSYEVNKK